jgi:hypothetical protein
MAKNLLEPGFDAASLILVYVRELVLCHSAIFQWIEGEYKAFGQVLLT